MASGTRQRSNVGWGRSASSSARKRAPRRRPSPGAGSQKSARRTRTRAASSSGPLTPEAQAPAGEGGPAVTLQSQVAGPEATVEGSRLEAAIQAELAQLEPEHRLLIVLRDVQGMSYSDILRITGLQEGTLKSRLHRARLALKDRLRPYMR